MAPGTARATCGRGGAGAHRRDEDDRGARRAGRPARTGRRPARRASWRSAAAVALVGVGVALVAPDGRAPAAAGRALPEELAGLPAQRSDGLRGAVGRELAAGSRPSRRSRDVAVRAYGGPGAGARGARPVAPRRRSPTPGRRADRAPARGRRAAGRHVRRGPLRRLATTAGPCVTCSTPQPGDVDLRERRGGPGAGRAHQRRRPATRCDLVAGVRDEVRAAEDR